MNGGYLVTGENVFIVSVSNSAFIWGAIIVGVALVIAAAVYTKEEVEVESGSEDEENIG